VENSSFEEQIHSRLRELTDELRRIRRELSEEIRHRPSHTHTPPEQPQPSAVHEDRRPRTRR
jgi:hypothetical protein